MIITLPRRYAPVWVCALFMAVLIANTASAQKASAKKTKVTKPFNKIEIVSALSDIGDKQLRERSDTDPFEYSAVNINLRISGKPPENDVPVKLTIQSFTTDATFFTGSASSDLEIRIIKKNLFNNDGTEKIITIAPITVQHTASDKEGDAFIGIQGQKSSFHHITFKASKKPATNQATNTEGQKPATANNQTPANSNSQKPAVADSQMPKTPTIATAPGIQLLDTTDQVLKLDTLQSRSVNIFPLKVYFKLSKGIGKDTTINVNISQQLPLSSIKLDTVEKGKTYAIKLQAKDWDKTKDINVEKTINVLIVQTAPVKTEQSITLAINYKDKQGIKQVIKIIPNKTAVEEGLVVLGDAEIVSVSNSGISHSYGSSLNAVDSIKVKLKLFGDFDEKHNKLSFEFLDKSIAKHFIILENPITVVRREWQRYAVNQSTKKEVTADSVNRKKKENIQIVSRENSDLTAKAKDDKEKLNRDSLMEIMLHIKTVDVDDSINNIQHLNLVLKGQSHAINRSKSVKVSIQDNAFWAEMGTNFDLLDNIKTNNFYAGVYMFDKDIARIGRGTKKGNNLSFTAGVYESQSVSVRSTSSAGLVYRNVDSAFRDTGSVHATTTVKSIGLLVSPHLRLTNGKTDANGLHVFFSAYVELLWQTVTANFDYRNTKRVVDTSLSKKINASNMHYPYKENSITYDFRSSYWGFGFPIYIKNNDFNLYINTVFGLTNQGFYLANPKIHSLESIEPANNPDSYIQSLTLKDAQKKVNGFYLIQYRLNAVTYGITFSGEIRGAMISGSKPIVTLAISKKFNISNLFNSVLGNNR
jgi:hypothetical protein